LRRRRAAGHRDRPDGHPECSGQPPRRQPADEPQLLRRSDRRGAPVRRRADRGAGGRAAVAQGRRSSLRRAHPAGSPRGRRVGYRFVKVYCSQVLAAARLATSTLPMLRSADTNWLLTTARSATVPLLCATRWNFSEVPIALRLAISRLPFVESTVTNRPFATA